MPVQTRETLSLKILAVLGVVAALYFAKAIFMPLAMAVLLTFVLAPPVRILRGWGVPRVLASVLVVVLACAVILGMGGLLAQQLAQLAERLPQYQITITSKVQNLGSAFSGGRLEQFSRFLNDLNSKIAAPEPAQPNEAKQEEPKPAPVRLTEPPLTPMQIIQRIVQPLVDPLVTSGLIVVFVIFFLLEREDLRDRLIRLAGSHDLRRTTEAINDGAQRLSQYFLAQTGLNVVFGLIVAIALTLIGVPNSVLWGILATLLRFVPYVGAFLAAAFPVALAFAVDPGWSMVLWTVALFLVLEPLVGQVLEPLLYGRSTGVTPVAVIISATFWTWIWGPVGLILSTPLAVCLAVVGRHIDSLRFVEVMIGDEPPLTPAQTFYQRALAGDSDEATEQVEECLEEHDSLARCYDEVVLEALALAQIDMLRGMLDEERALAINHVVRSVVTEIGLQNGVPNSDEQKKKKKKPEQGLRQSLPSFSAAGRTGVGQVLCIGGPGPLDDAACEMLAQLLGKNGISTRNESSEAISSINIAQLDSKNVNLVCLSYFNLGGSSAYLRYAIRRTRRQIPGTKIIACMWGRHENDLSAKDRQALGADAYARSLTEAVTLCRELGGLKPPAVVDTGSPDAA
jgi:predicted PurR-regulated permease PerM